MIGSRLLCLSSSLVLIAGTVLGGGTAAAAPPDGQLHCLARAIYWEARNQPFNGQVAVAQVILNRTEDGRFPSDICGVVHQRTARGCQFEWVCTHGRRQPREREAWQRALHVAEIARTDYVDLVGGAIFFHDTSIRRWRHLEKTVRIGDIIFYREP